MQNPTFADNENIPLVMHHDKDIDYDYYNTLNTTRVDEATFTRLSTIEKTLRPIQKLKRNKLVTFLKYLKVTDKSRLSKT